jgi:RAP1 GTPase activating protein 1
MVQMVMSRNLEVAEIRKFESMLAWARHKIRSRPSTSKVDAKIEFKCTMERLARDLKLYRISPQDLIKVRQFISCLLFSVANFRLELR